LGRAVAITPALSGSTFFPNSIPVTIDGAHRTNINSTLWFSVSGRVTNSIGEPIAGIFIMHRAGTSTVTAVTDVRGNYRFSDGRSGEPTLSSNMTPAMAGMTLFPSQHNITVAVYNLTKQNFTVWFTVSDRVTDSATGAGVMVTLTAGTSSTSVFTDAQCNYRFSDMRNGTYTLSASSPGKVFSPDSRSVTVELQNRVNQSFTGSG